MRNSPVRFGIIGFGRIGARHAQRISENPAARLVAVCDRKNVRFSEMTSLYEAEPYLDYRDMLQRDDIDVVCVCRPNGLHCEMSIAAAEAVSRTGHWVVFCVYRSANMSPRKIK